MAEVFYTANFFFFFFCIGVFFHEHSRFTGQQGKGEAAGLEPGTFGFRAQVANQMIDNCFTNIWPVIHGIKWRNFAKFPGVKILWKGTVSS